MIMIDCVNLSTAHLFGDAVAAQHRLRHRVFIERQRWDLLSWEGMEFDQFDTPATTYFIWRNATGEALGVSRVAPTRLPYMLETLWPHMVTTEPLPRDPRVWEGSRIGIDRNVDAHIRRRVLGEIFCAYLEFGLRFGVERYLVLMPLQFLVGTLEKAGWPVEQLGPERKFGRLPTIAASLRVSHRILERVRSNMQIDTAVLRTADDITRVKAA
jgi:acyl homoserine lactone synthase